MTYDYATASDYFNDLRTYEYPKYGIKKECSSVAMAWLLISLDCKALGLEEPKREDIVEVEVEDKTANPFKDVFNR